MRFKEDYEAIHIEEDRLLIPVGDEMKKSRGMYAMNEEAMWLIQEMQKNDLSLEELAKRMCQEYDVDFDTAARDITDQIQRFEQMGLLVG